RTCFDRPCHLVCPGEISCPAFELPEVEEYGDERALLLTLDEVKPQLLQQRARTGEVVGPLEHAREELRPCQESRVRLPALARERTGMRRKVGRRSVAEEEVNAVVRRSRVDEQLGVAHLLGGGDRGLGVRGGKSHVT